MNTRHVRTYTYLKEFQSSQLFCAWALILLFVPFAPGEANKKIQVKDQSDLPRFTYPLSGPASVLLQADAASFNAFAVKVRTDLDAILRDYEIEDKATLRSLLSAKLDLQHLAGEDAAALETVKALRALEEKPSPRLTTGLYMRWKARSRRTARAVPLLSRTLPSATGRQSIRCHGMWCRTGPSRLGAKLSCRRRPSLWVL